MLRIVALVCALLCAAGSARAQSVSTTIIINNAPVYSNGATMTQGNAGTITPASRILGGSGCDIAGNTNGSNCWAWQALNAGTLSASGNPSTSWTCPTPAGVASAEDNIYGTSFPGISTETDNGITFACLYKIDNMTESEAYNDTTANWTTGTNYYPGTYVRNQGVIYDNVTPNLVAPYYCTSGGSMPSPPGFSGTITDGGSCVWQEVVSHPQYSSQANVWLHQIYNTCAWTACGATPQFSAQITIYKGYGGHDRQTYVPGQNNEDNPILEWWHYDYGPDHAPTTNPPFPIVTVPLGESFADNMSPTVALLGPDSRYGTMLEGTEQWAVPNGPASNNAFATGSGQPLGFSDSGVIFTRLQFKSDNGIILNTHQAGPGNTHVDALDFEGNLIDAGGGWGAIHCDGGCTYHNDVVIDRSLIPGSQVATGHFGTYTYDNTMLCNGSLNSFATMSYNNLGSDYIYNNLVLGCMFPHATGSASPPIGGSGNNGTDVASGSIGTSFTSASGLGPLTANQMPSTTINGMVPANELVQPAVQSPVQVTNFGAGANYGVTSQSASFTSVAPNSTAVCGVGTSGATITSFTASGLTWTLRGGNSNIQVYAAPIVTPGSYTATANFATSAGIGQVACIVAAGTPTSSFFDPNGALPSTAGTVTPSITTTQANDLLIAFFVCSNQIFSNNVTAGWEGGNIIQMVYQWKNVYSVQSGLTPAVSGSCTSGAAYGDALIENPVSSNAVNALLKSASAQSYGAGTMTLTGSITAPGLDIFGQSRTSRVDLGTVNFAGSSPPTLPAVSGRRFLH